MGFVVVFLFARIPSRCSSPPLTPTPSIDPTAGVPDRRGQAKPIEGSAGRRVFPSVF
jgi:hypothetical protein